MCRYCCKSPKLPGANFLAVKKSDRRPPIDVAPITLPRSPASLSSGNEVPHIFTRKSRVQPKEILITSAKRLLQQNLPQADICSAAKESYSITSSASHQIPERAPATELHLPRVRSLEAFGRRPCRQLSNCPLWLPSRVPVSSRSSRKVSGTKMSGNQGVRPTFQIPFFKPTFASSSPLKTSIQRASSRGRWPSPQYRARGPRIRVVAEQNAIV
jgi:hypothetical protein